MEVISDSPISLTTNYAGFFLRFLAYLIDRIIIGIVSTFLFAPFLAMLGFSATAWQSFLPFQSSEDHGLYWFSILSFGAIGWLALVAGALNWIYFAGMESSRYQATIGKMIMGIRVMSLDGKRISFLNATGRYFGKILSGMILFIGYLMAAFTPRKQALHDILAGTLVMRD